MKQAAKGSSEENRQVDENWLLAEVLQIQGAAEVLNKYSLPCMGCPLMGFEVGMLRIGEVCRTYGIDSKKVIKDLNSLLKKKK